MPVSKPSAKQAALAAAALAEIPKLLTLQDRTALSATYGCFDRAYWHYRMMDFPCGMSQEFVWPLALVWSQDIPGNPYYQQSAIRDWVKAGILYAARSAHPDGSCDDYYPFERAAGAAAFSLLACLEAARIIGVEQDPEIDAFFVKRATWLAHHRESGRLSNHEALITACLARMVQSHGASFEPALQDRAARLLSWQDSEGWFDEYGGADPGYLSLTIGLLADTDRLRPDLGLREPCRKAIDFLANLAHPDGTLGGEYTSRATRNFFPHGLEIAGSWYPKALALNERLLEPLTQGRGPCFSDDHIVGHHLWSWLLTWKAWQANRPEPHPLPVGQTHLPHARLLIDERSGQRLYCGLSRGGAFKLFDQDRLVVSDTGPSLQTSAGKIAVTHLEGTETVQVGADFVEVSGSMAWAKATRLTPAKSVILRVIMLTVGRFFPDLIRKLLQALLVTGRKDAPFLYHRRLSFQDGGWTIVDTLTPQQGWEQVSQAGIGGFQTSVTTIMARVWHPEQLQPWLDVSGQLAGLGAAEPLVIRRVLTQGLSS
jgi:hypothetical protein